jgi:hypothetical protein
VHPDVKNPAMMKLNYFYGHLSVHQNGTNYYLQAWLLLKLWGK